jgi:tetratricopeptide (TPR) repeat protein
MIRPALMFLVATGFAMPAAAQEKEARLPENTIDCKQFKKTGPQEWIEVGTAVFDLGKIPDINLTNQPVKPRSFKFGGIDLYPVLEGKCGAAAYFAQGKTDRANGNYESALANFDQAILLDPSFAAAYDSRGEVYANKGDYTRAIADYNEALRLDLRLESAANHRTIAAEKLAQENGAAAPAEPKADLAVAAADPEKAAGPEKPAEPKGIAAPEKVAESKGIAAPEKEAEPKGTALASVAIQELAKGEEQTEKNQEVSITKNGDAGLASQTESRQCGGAQAQKCRVRRRHSARRPRRFYDDLVRMFRAQR